MAVHKGPSTNSSASDLDGTLPTATVGGDPPPGVLLPEAAGSPSGLLPEATGSPSGLLPEANVALAWRLLSSPRTLLGLSFALTLVLMIGAALPQRPTAAELARRLSFASGDAATGLGLLDVLTAWPTLLLLLLLVLNAAGIFIARRLARAGAARGSIVAQASALVPEPLESVRARIAAVRIGGRGLAREGGALALLGVVALIIGFVVARGSALDARLELAPGTRSLSEAVVRDGDLFLPRTLPYGLMCERPDPQDARRAFDCRLAGTGATEPAQVFLAPGYGSRVGDLELSPLREVLRRFSETEPYDLVLTRNAAAAAAGAAPAVERLRLEPGKTVALRASGQQLTAFAGADGPLVVVEADGARPVLLAPLADADQVTAAAAASAAVLGDLRVEALAATQLVVAATSSPEAPLVLAGTLLIALGLLLMGLVPHLELVLEGTTGGTRITVWSANRPDLPKITLLKLVAQASATPAEVRS